MSLKFWGQKMLLRPLNDFFKLSSKTYILSLDLKKSFYGLKNIFTPQNFNEK